MSHLKTLLYGKGRRAVIGMGYSGTIYDQAWNTLQRNFGQPRHIVSSQLAKIQKFPPIRLVDLSSLIELADLISMLVSILQQFGLSNNFFCSINFRLSIYSSYRIVSGIIRKLVKRRILNLKFFLKFAFSD